MRAWRARWVFTPAGFREDAVVEVGDHGEILRVRPALPGDPAALDGLLVPGLVNAHTHLELSWLAGRVPPSPEGFAGWVSALMRGRRLHPGLVAERVAARAAVAAMAAAGVVAACDVTNRGDTAEYLVGAGISGIAQVELLGFDARTLPARLRVAALRQPTVARGGARVIVRPAAHAPYSTPPALIAAALRPHLGAPGTIHLAEDPAELAFLRDGTGPFAALLDRLGLRWRWWTPEGRSPAEHLDALGVLGPGALLVHGVALSASDLALLAARRAPLCLCPRSNRHVVGRLPDVPAMLAAGVRLCLGTDSLTSSPDLDPLGEIPVLAAAFPAVPIDVWLALATAGGADALGLPGFGRFVPGARPGVVWLEGVASPEALRREAPVRRLVLAQGGG